MNEARGNAQAEQVGLTCLRGLAALWVVLFHFARHFDHVPFHAQIARGYLAVDAFFVLSGFILAYVYLDSVRSGTFRYRSFLKKRFARLYPVHLATMLAAFVILAGGSLAGLSSVDLAEETKALLPTSLMLHAYGYPDELRLNYPSWSISAEFFAYIFFPVVAGLCLVVRRPLLLGIGLLLIFTASAQYIFDANLFRLNSLGAIRIIPEFFLGIATFLAVEGKAIRCRAPFYSLLAAPLLFFLGPDWSVVIGAAALIAILYMGNAHLAGARIGPAIHLGHISYSIYMVHGLVEMVGFKLVERLFGYPDDSVPLPFLPLMLGGTILVGHLTWRWVENPGRKAIMRLHLPSPLRRRRS